MLENMYDLTNPQKSIWLSEQTYQGMNVNTICGTIFFKEQINTVLLQETIKIFIQKNDAMKTRLIVDNGKPKQSFIDIDLSPTEIVELNSTKELNELEKKMAETPFDLLNSNLFKFKIFKLKDGTGGIIGLLHHLISDAWSFGIMSKELKSIYENLLLKKDFLEDNPSYIDYVQKEQEYFDSEKYVKDKEYWDTQYKEVPDLATLKQYLNDNNSTKAKRYKAELNINLCKSINKYSKNHNTSSYSFLNIHCVHL